jgi:hypothetical protein
MFSTHLTTALLVPGACTLATDSIDGACSAVQILEIKTESPDLIAALSTLSAVYPDNTPAARRHLRSTIEERGLGINEQFLEAAEGFTKVRLGLCVCGGGGQWRARGLR